MNRSDRRSKRTETALLNALSELLQTKHLCDITVNELVDLANLHRSTFYLHYKDIYDLYEQAEESFLTLYKTHVRENTSHDYSIVYQSILNYIDSNHSKAAMFFGKNAEPSFQNKIAQFLIEQYVQISAFEDGVEIIPEDWNLMAVYHMNGLMNLMIFWIQSGFQTPKEKMLELFLELDMSFAAHRRKKQKAETPVPRKASAKAL